MCAPGTIETVRERFEEDDSFVRVDRRAALVAGAGAALAAALPGRALAGPVRSSGHAQDLTHVFRESLPLFADIFPRPTRDTFVTVPADGFYARCGGSGSTPGRTSTCRPTSSWAAARRRS